MHVALCALAIVCDAARDPSEQCVAKSGEGTRSKDTESLDS